MNPKEKLIELLLTFGYPVSLQGTYAEGEQYPDTFITFWTDGVDDGAHYDNDAVSFDWQFSVMFYSRNPVLVNTKPADIRALLKSNGFIPQGKGMDIPSDEPTHTGWALEVTYTEK